MGGFSPPEFWTDILATEVADRIMRPVIQAMSHRGVPYRGVLYAGLMLTAEGPKVLEYNVRFGDPECQPLLMRLKSDLLDLLEATVDGRLEEIAPFDWDERPAVCVVIASAGYPGSYETGHVIRGLAATATLPDFTVFPTVPPHSPPPSAFPPPFPVRLSAARSMPGAHHHHAFHEDAEPGDLGLQLPIRSFSSSKKFRMTWNSVTPNCSNRLRSSSWTAVTNEPSGKTS